MKIGRGMPSKFLKSIFIWIFGILLTEMYLHFISHIKSKDKLQNGLRHWNTHVNFPECLLNLNRPQISFLGLTESSYSSIFNEGRGQRPWFWSIRACRRHSFNPSQVWHHVILYGSVCNHPCALQSADGLAGFGHSWTLFHCLVVIGHWGYGSVLYWYECTTTAYAQVTRLKISFKTYI